MCNHASSPPWQGMVTLTAFLPDNVCRVDEPPFGAAFFARLKCTPLGSTSVDVAKRRKASTDIYGLPLRTAEANECTPSAILNCLA